eukprot:g2715.t1
MLFLALFIVEILLHILLINAAKPFDSRKRHGEQRERRGQETTHPTIGRDFTGRYRGKSAEKPFPSTGYRHPTKSSRPLNHQPSPFKSQRDQPYPEGSRVLPSQKQRDQKAHHPRDPMEALLVTSKLLEHQAKELEILAMKMETREDNARKATKRKTTATSTTGSSPLKTNKAMALNEHFKKEVRQKALHFQKELGFLLDHYKQVTLFQNQNRRNLSP